MNKFLFLILSLFISTTSYAQSLAEKWDDMSAEMESLWSEIDVDDTFLFEFYDQTVDGATHIETERIKKFCGKDSKISDFLSTKDLSIDEFLEKHVSDISSSVHDLFTYFPEERFQGSTLLNELEILLSIAALAADKITLVSAGGDCQGHWGSSHYIIEIQKKTYSYSLGGGE